MILLRLVGRSLRRDRARALCAVAGVAAASGLLAWYLCLKQTADAQAPAAARRSTAPFAAWIGGFAPPSGDSLAPYAAWIESADTNVEVAFYIRCGGSPLALATARATLPVAEGPGVSGASGTFLVSAWTDPAPDFAALAALDEATKAKLASPDPLDAPPAVFSRAVFAGARSMPAVGAIQALAVPGRTVPLRVAGFFDGPGAGSPAPAVWTTPAALRKLRPRGASPVAPDRVYFRTVKEAEASVHDGLRIGRAAERARTALEGKAAALAAAGGGSNFRRRAAAYEALPPALLAAAPEGSVALRTISVQLDARPGGSPLQGPPIMAMAAEAPAGGSPFASQPLAEETDSGAWAALSSCSDPLAGSRSPAADAQPALFATSLFGTRLPRPAIGEHLPVILAGGTVDLVVAGFFESDGAVKEFPTLYTTAGAMARIARLAPAAPRGPNLLLLPSMDAARAALAAAGAEKLELPPPARRHGETPPAPPEVHALPDGSAVLLVDRDGEATTAAFVSDAVRNLRSSMNLSLPLAVITAIAMLVTVLSAGLAAERRRLALLRCAGLTRGGAARLIALETLLLALAGWAVGFLGAAGAMQLFLWTETEPGIPATLHVGAAAPLFSLALAVFAALAAALVPALAAMRVRPLEAFAETQVAPKPVSPAKVALGLALALPIAALGAAEGMERNLRLALLVAVGLPCWLAGSVLLVHPLMRLVERVFVRPVAWLLALDPRILSRRLSRAPGRAMGAVLSISLGLVSFVAIHTWGGTLMAGFMPSPEWPDAIVSLLPGGLAGAQAKAVCDAVEKPRGGAPAAAARAIPLEAFVMPLDETFAASRPKGFPASPLQILGADPDALFGAGGLAPMRFVEGDAASAAKALADGPACVIPAMLSRLGGLHKGDEIVMGDGTRLAVAGVVELNWHMVTSRSLVRQRSAPVGPMREMLKARKEGAGGPGAMPPGLMGGGGGRGPGGGRPAMGKVIPCGVAITSEKTARELSLEDDSVHFLWCDFSPELRAGDPLQATLRLDEALRAAIAETPDGARALRGCSVQVHHRDEIADGTLAHGGDVIGMMARLPFWSLVVTCTGIAALLVASARAGKRETDVMRAVGLTRGQLARLYLGEALLVIACTLALSLAGGLLVGWCFTGVTRAQWNAGLPVQFIVPWAKIAQGFLFAFALSFFMALLPLRRLAK